MERVYYLTVVHNGHVSLTSIIADNDSAAKVKTLDVFNDMLGETKACEVQMFSIHDGIVVCTNNADFKASLISA